MDLCRVARLDKKDKGSSTKEFKEVSGSEYFRFNRVPRKKRLFLLCYNWKITTL